MKVSSAEIQTLEEQLLDPQVRKSLDELANLIADDFIEIGSSGKRYNKEEVIEALQVEETAKIAISDFNIMQPTMDIVLTAYTAVKINDDGTEIKSLRSSVWRFNNGRWQIVFHRGTILGNSSQ